MKGLARLLQKGANLIGALMFLAIFLLFLVQIVARYVFSWPLGWPDEAITFLFVWVAFWGGALMVPLEKHITFDLLHDTLPGRWKRFTEIASLAVTGLLFAAAIPVTADFLVFSHRQTTSVMDIPLSVVYVPVLLLLVAIIVRIALRIASLVTGDRKTAA